MTRNFGSLKSYLVDLWKRCFAKEYLVKAEGNSTAVHDFRKCSRCGGFVSTLKPSKRVNNCPCGNYLLVTGYYDDKKRKRLFTLEKPLYSKIDVAGLIAIFIGLVVVISVLRLKQVPIDFKPDVSSYRIIFVPLVFLLCLFSGSILGSLMLSIGNMIIRTICYMTVLIITAVLCIASGFAMISPLSNGYHIYPYWVNIPSQQEINDSLLNVLGSMPFSAERYNYAANNSTNPLIDLQKEFMGAIEADFGGMMKAHPGGYLRLKANTPEERDFYRLYSTYLSSLSDDAKQKQCDKDPWGLATGSTVARYPETWQSCK